MADKKYYKELSPVDEDLLKKAREAKQKELLELRRRSQLMEVPKKYEGDVAESLSKDVQRVSGPKSEINTKQMFISGQPMEKIDTREALPMSTPEDVQKKVKAFRSRKEAKKLIEDAMDAGDSDTLGKLAKSAKDPKRAQVFKSIVSEIKKERGMAEDIAEKVAEKTGKKVGKKVGKRALKAIPIIGPAITAAAAAFSGGQEAMAGDIFDSELAGPEMGSEEYKMESGQMSPEQYRAAMEEGQRILERQMQEARKKALLEKLK